MGKQSKRTPRKYPGVTLLCEACGEATPRVCSTQRFCKAEACRKVAKRGTSKRLPPEFIECEVCKKRVVRKNKAQIRCGSDECYKAANRKTKVLGRIRCPFCKRRVKKKHPWQKCCGTRQCRNALIKANKVHTRKHFGKMFTCDECGNVVPRTRSNQRFCSEKHCQHVSKFGKRKPEVELTCPHCEKVVVRRNTRQVTCGSAECKAKRDRGMLLKRNPPKRTGKRPRCRFCKERFIKLSSIHVTCNKPECAKKQKQANADEDFRHRRRLNPVICPLCERPIKEKRFRKHPKCSKREAADKKRLTRGMKEQLTAQKAEEFRNTKPRTGPRISKRMEELKCVSKQRRTY